MLNPFSQILQGRYWPRPCLLSRWNGMACGRIWVPFRAACSNSRFKYFVLFMWKMHLRVPIWTWMCTDSVLPQEKTGGEGVLSVFRVLIFVCALWSTSFLLSFVVMVAWLEVGHLLGHNNSSHTAELCRMLFPLNLKKVPTLYLASEMKGSHFNFLRFYLLLMGCKISLETPF